MGNIRLSKINILISIANKCKPKCTELTYYFVHLIYQTQDDVKGDMEMDEKPVSTSKIQLDSSYNTEIKLYPAPDTETELGGLETETKGKENGAFAEEEDSFTSL